jgi:hypothetical protein
VIILSFILLIAYPPVFLPEYILEVIVLFKADAVYTVALLRMMFSLEQELLYWKELVWKEEQL